MLLPAHVDEEMYVARIDGLFDEGGEMFAHCHWYARAEEFDEAQLNMSCPGGLRPGEIIQLKTTDANPLKSIESKCRVLDSEKAYQEAIAKEPHALDIFFCESMFTGIGQKRQLLFRRISGSFKDADQPAAKRRALKKF